MIMEHLRFTFYLACGLVVFATAWCGFFTVVGGLALLRALLAGGY